MSAYPTELMDLTSLYAQLSVQAALAHSRGDSAAWLDLTERASVIYSAQFQLVTRGDCEPARALIREYSELVMGSAHAR